MDGVETSQVWRSDGRCTFDQISGKGYQVESGQHLTRTNHCIRVATTTGAN